jgi:hypothetical protein
MIVPEDFLLKVGRQAVFDLPALTFRNTSNDGATEWDVNDVNIKSTKSFIVKSPCIELDGAVHTKSIVSGPVQATGYSIGDDGGAYSGVTIDTDSGSGSNPVNLENLGGGNQNNRHAAAWEEVCPALIMLADCIEQIAGCSNTDSVKALAQQAKMLLTRGE